MSVSLLIVDDEPTIRLTLRHHFEKRSYEVFEAGSGGEGLELVREASPDVVLLDVRLPDIGGLDVLSRMKAAAPHVVVIMMTAHGDTETAREARHRGAFWFFSKPIDLVMLDLQVEQALEHAQVQRRGQLAEQRVQALQPSADSLGDSEAMRAIDNMVTVVAESRDTTVLLLGESGTGKGVVAEAIHRRSPRRDAPFQEINCAGLSETFLETELFGAERGAYTDAKQLKRGLLEVADGGTVFLDEIGDLSPSLQPKLLKVLESRRFRRLGGVKDIDVDVRIVAATHKDLDSARRSGALREDLFYRLNVMPVRLPPLRERGRDALVLASRFLVHFAKALGRPAVRFSPEAEEALLAHDWPGNVRELKNAVERALILCTAEEVGPQYLPLEVTTSRTRRLAGAAVPAAGAPAPEVSPAAGSVAAPPHHAAAPASVSTDGPILTLEEVEREHITAVLARLGGNRSQTAQALGISRSTLIDKLKKYRLEEASQT